MILYIDIFLFCVVMFVLNAYINDIKMKKIITIITLAILCIVSGTRYNIGGTDYFAYKAIFDLVPSSFSLEKIINFKESYNYEIGFISFMTLIKSIGFSYYGFTLINSIVFYYIFYLVIKRYNYNMNFIIIVFLYKMFFYNTFISMRQSIAILIFWLSLPYLKSKKYIKYYVLCIIMFVFHRSAIVLFMVPLITNFKISKRMFGIILLGGIISYIGVKFNLLNINGSLSSIFNTVFSSDKVAMGKIAFYVAEKNSGMSIFYMLEYYLIAIYVYIYYEKICKIDENAEFFIKIFICMLPFYTLLSSFSIVTRLKDFFFLSYPIMIIYISKILRKKTLLIYMLAITICFYGYYRYLVNFDNGSLINYKSFIFNNEVSVFSKID